jgi:enamidase
MVAERGELNRIVVGTDCPAGSGVQPLGILRVVSYLASMADLDPAVAVALATGNTAQLHGLNRGTLVVGREADLAIVDTPLGSQAGDAMGALAIGDTLAVAGLIIDGVVRFTKSRNTPPPTRSISF